MKKDKIVKHYCDTCRNITTHLFDQLRKEVYCVNRSYHVKILWCQICGKRKDNGDCKHLEKEIIAPRQCPNCGSQVYDPFAGKIKMHDWENCVISFNLKTGGN